MFPIEELRNYMWDHLASTLIGINHDQTFNIYTGSGSNGKSILVTLMEEILGDYKGEVPLQLITDKRSMIGRATPEVAQLVGIRYAVIQEPSKGDSINEGPLKEITGGDKLTARALYKNSFSFQPQFNLVVCTNTLLDVKVMTMVHGVVFVFVTLCLNLQMMLIALNFQSVNMYSQKTKL